VIRAALNETERIVVLADGSKVGSVGMCTVAPIEQVATLVTDGEADAAEIRRIEKAGVAVIRAGSVGGEREPRAKALAGVPA
jgi:DeoR/GlpR family transcriptional regulator of sugar metabolism